MEITEHDFFKYELVRQSAVTNMWDSERIQHIQTEVFEMEEPLTRAQIRNIIQNYDKYSKKWFYVRNARLMKGESLQQSKERLTAEEL